MVFNADASIRYQPNSNYFGQDEFTYSVTAVEKNVTQTSTVNIEISAVNDAPQITMASKIDLDKNNLIFESNPIFEIYFSDVDSSDENFVFSARVNQNEVPASFTTTGDGLGNLQIDLSNLSTAGYFEVELFVSDGSASSSDTFSTWLIANKRVVTVAQDDDKSDGFDSGSTTNKDYYVYYLVGGDSSLGRTDYLFVADSLSENSSGS